MDYRNDPPRDRGVDSLNQTHEKPATTMDGGLMLAVAVLLLLGSVFMLVVMDNPVFVPGIILGSLLLSGFYMVQPNQAYAITLFGNYKGTDRKTGLRWIWPWYGKKKISVRVRNVSSPNLKVNDKNGNPIEIAAVVVWRVGDTAQALFDVDDYERFVDIQIETALRDITAHYAYDHSSEKDADKEVTLRGSSAEIGAHLREQIGDRVRVAGVVIDEAKLSHLAYAPEIAGAMLRRQQAQAVLAARQLIVQGAVEMVEHALESLSARNVVTLDDERRAAMVSNLLVVLCAEREVSPVVNTGTLHG
jgi:regulator of protease activity HflC (stomatin/prohibitin superfamily)